MKKKKTKLYIITGVAGMIGSTILPRLLKENNSIVVGIDNLKLGKIEFIKKYFKNKNFYFFKLNLDRNLNSRELNNLLKKAHLKEVWHLAANSDIQKGIDNLNVDYKDTLLTTINTIKIIKPHLKKDTKFIFSSSSAIYGHFKKNINENSAPYMPQSYYGAMKLASEATISSFSFSNNIQSFIFRFPNVVGTNLTHGVVYDLSKKIMSGSNYLKVLGNGRQQKPYSSVDEIIDCMIYLIKIKTKDNVNFYNIGTSDKGVMVKDIVTMLIKKFEYNKKIIYENKDIGWNGDIPYYRYSTSKMKKKGFKFRLNSKLTLKKTIEKISKKNLY